MLDTTSFAPWRNMETPTDQSYFNKLTLQRLRLIEIVACNNYLERIHTINAIAQDHGVDTAKTKYGLKKLCEHLLSLIDHKMVVFYEIIGGQELNESVIPL